MISDSTNISNNKPTFDKRKGIFNFGEDNNYPNEVKSVINNSVTASSCVALLKKFIKGKGVDVDFFVNKDNESVNGLISKIAEDIAYFNGFTLHIGYNELGLISSIKHIPFNWVRWGKEDVNGYKSRLQLSKNWHNKKDPVSEFDVYNPNVALTQISKVGIEEYKGQIFYSEIESGVYPMSLVHPAIQDADSEFKSSKFKNNLLNKGFLNNLIVVTKKFESQRQKEAFQSNFKSQLGVDGQGVFNHIEADLNSDELDKEIFFKEVNTNVNDKLFEYTDRKASDNVIKAFGVPPALIDTSNSSGIFGNSGELIKQMRIFLQEKTEDYRMYLDKVFSDFYKNSSSEVMRNATFEIQKLNTIDAEVSADTGDKVAAAQATLKGSVGGVQALLQIQQSVSSGATDLSAAIEIIKNIYGYDAETARKMLGTPKIETT